MQQPCRYNTIPYLVNNLPFSSGKAFFPKGIQTGAHPQFTSKQPSKNMESPFGPQRHSWSMLQLYRKGSDMTARVITPPLEGTSNFVGYGKIWTSDGGGRGVPGTLKGQCPDISSPFSEKSLFFFFVREGRSPQNVWEIPQILVTVVRCSTCSSILVLFIAHLCVMFVSNAPRHRTKFLSQCWTYLLKIYWLITGGYLTHMWQTRVVRIIISVSEHKWNDSYYLIYLFTNPLKKETICSYD